MREGLWKNFMAIMRLTNALLTVAHGCLLQSASFKGRRSMAMASSRWTGHVTDMAADALLLTGSRGEAVEVLDSYESPLMFELFLILLEDQNR